MEWHSAGDAENTQMFYAWFDLLPGPIQAAGDEVARTQTRKCIIIGCLLPRIL